MNKPVAWTNKYNLQAIAEEGSGSVWSEPYFDGDVPLYLHAEKTLTDEEIEQIANIELKYQIESSYASGVYDFARAILRKAQEK